MNEEYYSYTKEWFRRLAPIYDIIVRPIKAVRDKVVDFTDAQKGSSILDVATGTGKQAFAFAERAFEVLGIDLSSDMLRVAQKKNKYENVKFLLADATRMPLEDNRFDVACVSFALHDMPLTIREKVLQEMVRVTKPQAIIIVVDYALPENKVGRYLIYHFIKLYEGQYYPEFINSDLKILLRKSGFEIEAESPILWGAGRVLKGIRME